MCYFDFVTGCVLVYVPFFACLFVCLLLCLLVCVLASLTGCLPVSYDLFGEAKRDVQSTTLASQNATARQRPRRGKCAERPRKNAPPLPSPPFPATLTRELMVLEIFRAYLSQVIN